jgi:hypothetical protein
MRLKNMLWKKYGAEDISGRVRQPIPHLRAIGGGEHDGRLIRVEAKRCA